MQEWSGGVKTPCFLLSGPNSSPVSWASLRFSLLDYIEYFGIMYQSVVGKLSSFRHCCIHCCYLTSKQRRTMMKKSTHTSNVATSGQVFESGSTRGVTIPIVPVRIVTYQEESFKQGCAF